MNDNANSLDFLRRLCADPLLCDHEALERVVLADDDFEQLAESLLRPPAANDELRRLMREPRDTDTLERAG